MIKFDLYTKPENVRDARVLAGQSCHFILSLRDNIAVKITTTFKKGEEVLGPTEADRFLDPASAIGIKPDTDLLRVMLLFRSHVA